MQQRIFKRGMFFRTFLLLVTLSLVIILIFAMMMIPRGKQLIIKGLASESKSLSVSIAQVCGNAFISGDYSFIVDHNMQLMRGATDIRYIIVVKSDGLSLIHREGKWEMRDKPDPAWNPQGQFVEQGKLIDSGITGDKVYHYSFPLEFSGIDWGMLYLGLSLHTYEAELRAMYVAIAALSLFCMLIAVLLSLVFTRNLTAPVLKLRETADRIVQGDMQARANITSGDEVEELAHSFNRMTESMLKAQENIAAARDYTQNILRSINEAILVLDTQGRITMANRAARDWLGYQEPEIVGKDIARVLKEVDDLVDSAGRCNLTQGIMLANREKTFITKGGGEITVLFSASVMEQQNVLPESIVCVALDITEQKQAALALQSSREEALAANRAKSQFLANMSHEIRTPMNGVLGMVDLLLSTDLNVQQRQFAETAFGSANILLHLLDDILDLSKIESGKLSLEKVDFDLRTTIDEVLELFAVHTHAKSVSLSAIIDERTITIVQGDPVRLRQVLINLVGNAVKFTKRGSITMSLEQVGELSDAVMLQFQVSDSGSGISLDDQQIIFDVFRQADSSTTRKHGGTGLGLAISRELVTMMGGEIGVQSIPGQGSTFWFTAKFGKGSQERVVKRDKIISSLTATATVSSPDGEQPRQGTLLPGAAGGGYWGSCRILLAEDNLVNQQVTMAMISARGCHVDVVGSGKDAVEAVFRSSYNMVLMDCQMPEMDGYEATKKIRERERLSSQPRTPIIALTANAMQGDREECLDAGMDDYLPKPFRQEQLLVTLNRWFNPAQGKTPGPEKRNMPRGTAMQAHSPVHVPIDKAVLNELQVLQKEGAPDLVAKVVTLFLADAPTLVKAMEDAVQGKDAQAICQVAHKLKSSSATVGALHLAFLLKQAEEMGRGRQIEGVSKLSGEIREEFDAVEIALEAELEARK